MSWIEAVDSRIVALVVLGLQLVAAEVGWAIGVRRTDIDTPQRYQAGAVQAAVLALMGLLLAFSFSMAAERYEERRDLVVEESAAIGTAYLRARMLPDAESEAVRGLLREYVDTRLTFFAAEDPGAVAAAIHASEVLLGRIWALVTDSAVARPGAAPGTLLVEAMNLVVDLHAERIAANEARIPPRILVLLAVVAVAGLGVVGWCFGLCRGPHRGPCVLVAFLVSIILLVILDLDEPLHGYIRIDQESLRHLQEALMQP